MSVSKFNTPESDIMKKVLSIFLFFIFISLPINSAHLVKPVSNPTPVVAAPSGANQYGDESYDVFTDETPQNSGLHNFTFVNNFNASVAISVVTDLTQKPQVITVQPRKEDVITGKCLYYVKVSSGKSEIALIPGLGIVNDASSIILTDNHKLCSSSKFQIKNSSTKAGFSLTHIGL